MSTRNPGRPSKRYSLLLLLATSGLQVVARRPKERGPASFVGVQSTQDEERCASPDSTPSQSTLLGPEDFYKLPDPPAAVVIENALDVDIADLRVVRKQPGIKDTSHVRFGSVKKGTLSEAQPLAGSMRREYRRREYKVHYVYQKLPFRQDFLQFLEDKGYLTMEPCRDDSGKYTYKDFPVTTPEECLFAVKHISGTSARTSEFGSEIEEKQMRSLRSVTEIVEDVKDEYPPGCWVAWVPGDSSADVESKVHKVFFNGNYPRHFLEVYEMPMYGDDTEMLQENDPDDAFMVKRTKWLERITGAKTGLHMRPICKNQRSALDDFNHYWFVTATFAPKLGECLRCAKLGSLSSGARQDSAKEECESWMSVPQNFWSEAMSDPSLYVNAFTFAGGVVATALGHLPAIVAAAIIGEAADTATEMSREGTTTTGFLRCFSTGQFTLWITNPPRAQRVRLKLSWEECSSEPCDSGEKAIKIELFFDEAAQQGEHIGRWEVSTEPTCTMPFVPLPCTSDTQQPFTVFSASVLNTGSRTISKLALLHKNSGLMVVDAAVWENLPSGQLSSPPGQARVLPESWSKFHKQHWWMVAWQWAGEGTEQQCIVQRTRATGLSDFKGHARQLAFSTALSIAFTPLNAVWNGLKKVGMKLGVRSAGMGTPEGDNRIIRELIGDTSKVMASQQSHALGFLKTQQTLGFVKCRLDVSDVKDGIIIEVSKDKVVLRAALGSEQPKECVIGVQGQTLVEDCLHTSECESSPECLKR